MAAPINDFHSLGITSLLEQLQSSGLGLTSDQARDRLATVGANEPGSRKRHAVATQLLVLLANPLVLILLIASGVSATLGEVVSASLIVVIVLTGVAVNFWQTYRSQRAIERLQQQIAPTADVLRDGEWRELPRQELVPGDVIRLAAGDLVPADARLLHSKDLYVQQAALTGESMPVEKEASAEGSSEHAANLRNSVFLGTSVVSGTAEAVVYATGPRTAVGDIAAKLNLRPPETEFERGTRRFSFFIMQTVLFLVLFVFLVNIALRHDPFQSLLFAVALAVGLTPEFLPMIVAVTLSQGAVRMARQHVIVKHLPAMQNFGSIDILCSDKTGTLTSGTMSLEQSIDPFANTNQRAFTLAWLNARHETGIKSPLDAAILKADAPGLAEYRKIDEVPFDYERRRMSVVVESASERLLICKGAAESVLAACRRLEIDGREIEIDAEARRRAEATHRELETQGFRVLAVAYRRAGDQAAFHAQDERDLTLVGFLSFCDPILPDVADALTDLRADGVDVKVLTGDNELVAEHVCAQAGMGPCRMVLGDELDSMTDTALGVVAEKTTLFARVSPAQKNRIILALKRRGHVVGFLGDGINDAPSLHVADVGISVASAVDVAKDAADIILTERSLRVLHAGIVEGRKAFGNVVKYLLMGTSSNFGNMLSMAVASLFLPFLPMLPTQVLLNNLLYDLSQVTIPTDNVDPEFVRKPLRWDISLIRKFMMQVGPISSLFDFLTFWVLLRFFERSESHFQTGWFIESLTTQTLVLLVIRTAGNPFRSLPSRALVVTVLLVVAIGIALPWTPLAETLGFSKMPAWFFVYLVGATAAYLAFVEVIKRRLLRRATI